MRGKPLERKTFRYGSTIFHAEGETVSKGQTGARTCESLRREFSGEPDAGNPHVRFEEGGAGRVAWHTVTEPRKGKPGHRSTPPPKLCSLLLYSTGKFVDGSWTE